MEIKDIKLSDIKPYKNNPRNNENNQKEGEMMCLENQ